MQDLLAARKVKHLYHFTRAENLDSILKYGLIARENLEERGLEIRYNDDYRIDNRLDAVCMSVEFPNYKMFFKLRQKNPSVDWVVLRLDAKILCEYPCKFFWTNAGNYSFWGGSAAQRSSPDNFEKLFCDHADIRGEQL